MSEPLTVSAPKQAILERVVFLISSGQTLTAASALIETETGQKAWTTMTQYRRAREVVARTSGAAMKTHGNRKLTERQEAIMKAVLVVLSGSNEAISAGALVKHVEKLFGVPVSRGWAKGFLKRNTKDNTERKAKVLANKRATTQVQASVLIADHQGANRRDCLADKGEELESLLQVADEAAAGEETQNCGSTHTNRDEEVESLRVQVRNLTRRNEELEALLKKMVFIADDAVKKANSLRNKKTREDVDNSGQELLVDHSC